MRPGQMFDCIESYCSTVRRNSTIGCVSVAEFEKRSGLAWLPVHEAGNSSVGAVTGVVPPQSGTCSSCCFTTSLRSGEESRIASLRDLRGLSGSDYRRFLMLDLVYLALGLAGFVVFALGVRAAERM